MSHTADRPATRLATRLVFFVAGFALACWAPLVPFAKQRLGIADATLGLLLLCLGLGSVLAMLATGVLAARLGSRPVIVASGLGLGLVLPLLALAGSPLALGLALLLFGACLGSLDVAMNVHALEVESAAGRPLMSGFHGFFSVGGFAGAALMTALLSGGLGERSATLLCAAPALLLTALAAPRLLRSRPEAGGPLFVRPRGVVLLIAALSAICFLVEGAVLDWSALLVIETGRVQTVAQGGLGYMLFAIAMTAGRFGGDAVSARLGDRRTLLYSGLLAVAGFLLLLLAAQREAALAGFLLIGLGAANIVPVLFRRAGAQTQMPPALAIAAVTTTGYAGMLVGPAAIGFVAQATGLSAAFWGLAGLMLLVPLGARRVAGL